MKPRDRLVVCALVAAAALAAVWIGVVSPKRNDAAQLGTRLTAAQQRLGAAQSQLTQAKQAETGYPENLRVVKTLYKAVPANDGVPRLLVALDKTSNHKRVEFNVITVPGAAAAVPVPGAAAVAPIGGGLKPIAFTFTFAGGYIALQHFLKSISSYTLVKGSQIVAHGRLLTIQSVALTPPQAAATTTTTKAVPDTTAAVTATAYSQLPATATTPTPSTTTVATTSTP